MGELLVVEDNTAICDAVESSLMANGHRVRSTGSGTDALTALEEQRFDLVLLDLGLPDVDGLDLCRRIRATWPWTVIVILTARDEEIDVVLGLDAGADDYLVKPFRLAELAARVRAHLRRREGATAGGDVVRVGPLEIDDAARRVHLNGAEITLRPKEYDLLARLAASAGRAVSRTELMSDVWDTNWFGSTKTLAVHVSSLRRRLSDAAVRAGVTGPDIVTLRGHGFRLEAAVTDRGAR